MKIGIIGIGNIGGTLARKLSAAGHEVRVANSRGADAVREFAQKIGATPHDSSGAVDGAEVVILSVPLPAVSKLPRNLFENVPPHVPVVDTCNYYPDMRDPRIPEIEAGEVESQWVSDQIGRPVIKAFNNILSQSLADLGRPRGAKDRLAVAIAGDDASAKAIVSELVNDVGFDPVDAGALSESWRQQPSTPAYCCDWNAEETLVALSAAIPGDAPRRRDLLPQHFAKLGADPAHSDMVKMNRELNAPDGEA